jgi:hypothetical protein
MLCGLPRRFTNTRTAANFSQLGFHHGFGLTVLLPPIVGQQRALELLMTGRPIPGEEASATGLLDRSVEPGDLWDEAIRFAAEIASPAPLAVVSIRATMREGLGARTHEQDRLRATEDFREGIRRVRNGGRRCSRRSRRASLRALDAGCIPHAVQLPCWSVSAPASERRAARYLLLMVTLAGPRIRIESPRTMPVT